MIQLERIQIEEFRGIRTIDLSLSTKTFVVHGPNGSGKSGVVDAIDFALTGSISRLVGAGTGGVTLASHGPHVHQRNNPVAAVVHLTLKSTATGAIAVLSRNIKDPAQYTLQPDTEEMREAIDFAQVHPELTLSRREIIKYVVAKPADRAQEVQTLLKLERLDRFRRLLRSAMTKVTSDLKAAETELGTSEKSFTGHLDISSLLGSEVAREINSRRVTLGLEPHAEVDIDTNFLDGLTSDIATRAFNLATAIKEVADLNKAVASPEDGDTKRLVLTSVLDDLANDPDLLSALKHRSLIEQGIGALESNSCPLCDKEWDDVALLREHLEEKLQRSDDARALRQRIDGAGEEYKAVIRALVERVARVIPVAEAGGDDELPHLLRSWSNHLAAHVQNLASFEALVSARSNLSVSSHVASPELTAKLSVLGVSLSEEPDQSATDAARSFLTVAKERWTRVRLARAVQAKTLAVRDAAKVIYESYCEVADGSLVTLYEAVEADFSMYYQKINSDDEGAFKAALRPAAGSLDLSVDFYGLGMFPPTAYHSEGHQDGMGVCLYLALVKRLLGSNFRYAVLDDVVMSVDMNHRRQFCELLKSQFPDVQFIITTHDEIWERQMRSVGLTTSKTQARFYGWTVDGGPVYEQGDIWERIEEDLLREDVPAAAHKLRRRLEAASADIAESIGGSVVYRGDANYDLSVLIGAVKGRYKDLLGMAAAAAGSWNDPAAKELVEARKKDRATVLPDQEAESWIINPLVHNNDWAHASVEDFRPVLAATKALLGLFMCDNADCGSWIYVVGRPEENLRCGCGAYNLNLRKKKP